MPYYFPILLFEAFNYVVLFVDDSLKASYSREIYVGSIAFMAMFTAINLLIFGYGIESFVNNRTIDALTSVIFISVYESLYGPTLLQSISLFEYILDIAA